MQLGSPRPRGLHQPCSLQHVEMLADRLTGQRRNALGNRRGAQFEQRLIRPLPQTIDDAPAGWIRERLEHPVERLVLQG